MLRLLAMAAAAVPALAAIGAELHPLVCVDVPVERLSDPLDRDGLSGVECPFPTGGGSVLIVSDENVSWPVIVLPGRRVSFEDFLLENATILGPGLFHFQPGGDAVLFEERPHRRLLVRYSSADPVSLERVVRWLALSLDPVVLGAAETPEAAAALMP